MCVLCCCLLREVNTLKNFLNLASPVGNKADLRMICLSLLTARSTKDSSSLSMVWRRWFIVLVGLNFAGARGEGKNARIVRSMLRITKLFVAGHAGVVGEAVRGV